MAELQRSAMSFRRQGSSGQVFDDKFLKELDKITKQQQNNNNQDNNNHIQQQQQQEQDEIKPTISVGLDRSRSNGGGRAFRTGKVLPAIEPPSPRLSACGICSAFGKREKARRKLKPGKRRL